MSSLKWTKIPTEALPRSSHSVSLVGKRAYIFGGEIKPRQPVDNAVHVVDISSGAYERVEGKGGAPDPRVGHVAATIGSTIHMFSGRGGPDMSPLEENGAVHSFSTETSTWSRLNPTTAVFPSARSYHCATATPTHFIVHAGCGEASKGRLADTWAFDVNTKEWTQLADAPGDGRGGTAITYAHGRLWRFGGFNGKTELGGAIDFLPLGDNLAEAKWETIAYDEASGFGRHNPGGELKGDTNGPGARSVHALLPLGDKVITFFGEGKPSPTGGHDSAGNFWGDVWSFDPKTGVWTEEKIEGEGPGERGRFSADQRDGKVAVWGGIDAANERFVDGWVLSEA